MRTTISVEREYLKQFRSMKPDGMRNEDFLNELMMTYRYTEDTTND